MAKSSNVLGIAILGILVLVGLSKTTPPPDDGGGDKTWLTWQNEIIATMSPYQPVHSYIIQLYNRMQADPKLAILGMTTAEQNSVNNTMYSWFVNIGGNLGMFPADFAGRLSTLGLTTEQVAFVFNGRNV